MALREAESPNGHVSDPHSHPVVAIRVGGLPCGICVVEDLCGLAIGYDAQDPCVLRKPFRGHGTIERRDDFDDETAHVTPSGPPLATGSTEKA
jgi:hypothetical protein